MTKRVITDPNEIAELRRLHEEYLVARGRCEAALMVHGMQSREFLEADKAVGTIWRRIREIEGDAGKHWMA